MKTVIDNIKALRLAKGLKQRELAQMLGITTQGYQKIESGESDLPLSRLAQIAEVHGVGVVSLFEGTEGTNKEDLARLEKRVLELERELDLVVREKTIIGNERVFLEHERENSIFLLEYCIEVLSEPQNDFKRENLINLLKSYIKDHEKAYKPMSSWFKELKKMVKNSDPDSKDVEK